jgi:2'-5' RNA ligase
MKDEKRLFFAAEIVVAWPREFPSGRILDEENRHFTLAFLGSTSLAQLLEKMKAMPTPSFHVGIGGYSTRWVFLPSEQQPRVAAVEVEVSDDLVVYQKTLADWLKQQGYLQKERRPFFPHITVARGSFDIEEWKKVPCSIPFYICSITLMESLGNSNYRPIWKHPLIPPFEEIEHTADIAFLIRGKNIQELWLHAQLALAFKFPPLIPFLAQEKEFNSLDTVIAALNGLVARADVEIGIPFKAVSYHDEMAYHSNHLEWKMIVDV